MKKITLLILLVPFFTFGQWIQLANDIDGEVVNDQSGYAVDLNADGNIIAIGAPFNDNNGDRSGNVRIFENLSGSWVQIGADINGSLSNSNSGFSVSISDDGNNVAIGAPDSDSNGFESGQVRVFENQSGNWTQIGDEIAGEAFSDHSGYSVSISGDGFTVAIGAPDNEGTVGGNFGHVRVLQNQSGTWEQIGDDIDGEAAEDKSGFSVALSEDGTIVAIGAPRNDGTDGDSGHVRIYQNQSGAWEQIGNDIDGEAMNDKFGSSVNLSADGTIVAIGAIDNNGIGHVRVFQNQSGAWVQKGDDIDGESIGDKFGSSVSLSANGGIIAIGAPLSDGAGLEKGRVKIYQNQSGNWTQIDDNIEGEDNNDRSGHSVSLSANGSIGAIGAHLNDGNGANSGHARIYTNSNILSLQESDFQDEFIVYPNPANNQVTIISMEIISAVSIYNILGQEIFSFEGNSHQVNFDISTLSAGAYITKVQVGEVVSSKKIIKL